MLGAMRYHAAHLFDFAGRDARQTFWYWFLFLFILNIVVGLAMSVPMMLEAMGTAMAAARTGDAAAAEAAVAVQMAGSLKPMLLAAIALGVVNVVLIAAAFVRRLHDSGKSALWAVIAGAIYFVSLGLTWTHAEEAMAMMQEMAATTDPARTLELQSRMAWQNLLGYLPLAMVIGFGMLLFVAAIVVHRYSRPQRLADLQKIRAGLVALLEVVKDPLP